MVATDVGSSEDRVSVHVFYASETGQAEAIATDIADRAQKEHKLRVSLHNLGKYDVDALSRVSLAVFVASTTGDGDPPDSCVKFFRFLRRKKDACLEKLRYAFLALGDTNYTNFCNFGKNLDEQLGKLGAVRFYDTGYADDGTGLELVVEPWRDQLWHVLQREVNRMSATAENNDDGKDVQRVAAPAVLSFTANISDDPFKSYSLLPIETAKTTESSGRSSLNYTLLQTELLNATESAVNPANHDNELALTVPIASPSYLNVEFYDILEPGAAAITGPPLFDTHPSQNGPVFAGRVVQSKRLSQPGSVRETWDTTFEVVHSMPRKADTENSTEVPFDYEPGDTVAIFAPNPMGEVEELIERLELVDEADRFYRLTLNNLSASQIDEEPKKKAGFKKLPTFVPHSGATLRYVLTNCFDIRACPRKGLLRCLAECVDDSEEKQQLLKWCSKEFPFDYKRDITDRCLTLLNVLLALPHTRMPVHLLFEHVPKLFPRPYSIASSPLPDTNFIHADKSNVRFSIAWNLEILSEVEPLVPGESANTKFAALIPASRPPKLGVATGYLQRLSEDDDRGSKTSALKEAELVYFYRRFNYGFRLPSPPETTSDVVQPLLLIATGTGIAPFIGFLEHIDAMRRCTEQVDDTLCRSVEGNTAATHDDDAELRTLEAIMKKLSLRLKKAKFDVWLIFGCRHEQLDFIYRAEVDRYVALGVLSRLDAAFSRDNDARYKYVGDIVRAESTRVADWIVKRRAHVYVCGDLLKMGKVVNESITEVLIDNIGEEKKLTAEDAAGYMKQMRLEKRYVEDLWS